MKHLEILEFIEKELNCAVKSRKHAMRTAMISTCFNNSPSVRCLVLRRFSLKDRSLRFHADVRSKKVAQLKKNPLAEVLFYSKLQKTQLRFTGKTSIHHNNSISKEHWENSQNIAKICYISESPGTELEKPFSNSEKKDLTAKEFLVKGYMNFCVIELHFSSIDYLFLENTGNLRVFFEFQEGKKTKYKYLAP